MSTSSTSAPAPAQAARAALAKARTLVIKVGSSLLTDPREGLARDVINRLSAEVAALRKGGRRVLLVSSGAVLEGVARLGFERRPETIHELQAAAAVGQMGLIEAYEQAFSATNLHTALVLLTHDDLADRQRYLNARATLSSLLERGVIPIINENDSVATDEIRFGDNDTLAALVANLLQAELLIVLTDIDGLYSADPRAAADGTLVSWAAASDGRLDAMVAGSGEFGRGGMITKLQAARLAARSGAHTVIAGGRRAGTLGPRRRVQIAGRHCRYRRTFGDAPSGEPFWYENSNGLLELAVANGHAARELGLGVGSAFRYLQPA